MIYALNGRKGDDKYNSLISLHLNYTFSPFSAVGILAINGKIIMTLCKGQGGTPVDQPLRSWHDSWQVVAMAANADLVLSHVIPFEAELYQQYSCTGFR